MKQQEKKIIIIIIIKIKTAPKDKNNPRQERT
jgi:hypothetical protein